METSNAKILETAIFSVSFKRESVFLTIILAIITLGTYIPFWFLKRRKKLNQVGSEERISFVTPFLLFILYGIIALTVIPVNFYTSGFILIYYQYIDMVITYLGITITLYLTFQVRNILMHNVENISVNHLLTFFFHIFYLQYKINKLQSE